MSLVSVSCEKTLIYAQVIQKLEHTVSFNLERVCD